MQAQGKKENPHNKNSLKTSSHDSLALKMGKNKEAHDTKRANHYWHSLK